MCALCPSLTLNKSRTQAYFRVASRDKGVALPTICCLGPLAATIVNFYFGAADTSVTFGIHKIQILSLAAMVGAGLLVQFVFSRKT